MDIRYSVNQRDFKRYTTQEMRDEFLITNLYRPDEVVCVYSHVDRMVTFGCMPVNEEVPLEKGIDVWHNFGTDYILERREIGIFNIGGAGCITADDDTFNMNYKDCLYITQGTKKVTFKSVDPEKPAKFYMVSAPAHCAYKTTFIPIEKANKRPVGAMETSNKRTINQFIHPDVLKTCQLSMGMTVLEPGSMMGEGNETRHIVMQNEEAVISPSWSIHSGAGTSNYTFIWAMGGENQAFDDMDNIPTTELR